MKTRNRVTTTDLTKTTGRAALPAPKPADAVEIEPLAGDSDLDVWITAGQACRILGVGRTAIYRLIDGEKQLLVSRRPLPRKLQISLRSVKALAEATKNPEFWASSQLREEHQRKLKGIVFLPRMEHGLRREN